MQVLYTKNGNGEGGEGRITIAPHLESSDLPFSTSQNERKRDKHIEFNMLTGILSLLL